MAKLTAEIMNGQRVVWAETEDEVVASLDQGLPVRAPTEIVERLGIMDELPPEEWEEELRGEREWVELQKEWAEEDRLVEKRMDASSPFSQRGASPSPAVVIPFPNRVR